MKRFLLGTCLIMAYYYGLYRLGIAPPFADVSMWQCVGFGLATGVYVALDRYVSEECP